MDTGKTELRRALAYTRALHDHGQGRLTPEQYDATVSILTLATRDLPAALAALTLLTLNAAAYATDRTVDTLLDDLTTAVNQK